MSGRGGKAAKRARSTRSQKAGLIFPVSRVHRFLRKTTHHYRIASGAPVYQAAVMEYLTAEILELAGNAARDNKRSRIIPRHILLAIANDDELHKLLRGVTIAQGGVLPKIHPELLKKRKGGKLFSPEELKRMKEGKKVSPKKVSPKKKVTTSKKDAPTPKKGNKGKDGNEDGNKLGPGFTMLSEKTLFLGQSLCVVQGNIVEIDVDAIVNPTSSKFNLSGEVGNALKKAGGKSFEEEVETLAKDKSPLEIAGVAACQGHGFPAKFVIHVNAPVHSQKDAVEKVEEAVKNILTLADEKNLKSIALPSIGSGAKAEVKAQIVQAVLKTISDYFVTVMASSLKQITFVMTKMDDLGVYSTEMAKLDA
ncbi:core histone macro-H2A.1-like [Xenia sp. Carnegie-2017]|uniref:core histone macro-H2A.1-like n=1 Tax=Xenia sp. Carnegie-2017 TaxID=2897299 RepID=UPI001F040B8E|nr:core histone macro-H2A.1-like [Xenia sp. Carnegie-2017]XP_046856763.1 core histone macro-H2A.1-like [Xenia sp. Carnegie-2017]